MGLPAESGRVRAPKACSLPALPIAPCLDRCRNRHHDTRNRTFKEGIMLKNLHYDMIEEIAELSKSLSRMETYAKDSTG